MKKSLVVLALVGMVMMISATSFAGTSYVVTNDDNCVAASNTSSVYTLNTTTGKLTLLTTLTTGGLGNCGGFFATVGNGVSQDHKCLYIMDGGTSDIAAFTVPALAKVGNYSNGAVAAGFPGGSMALTGNFLYETYAGTENIGAWKRNADCSLTFIAAYQASAGADTYSNIVAVGGKEVVVSVDDLGFFEAFSINQTTGALTDLGNDNLSSTTTCASSGCFPTGIDVTKGGLLFAGDAILGSAGFSVQLTPGAPYFSHSKFLTLNNTAGMVNNEVPWLSAAAYNTGTGALYWGFSGDGLGEQPGVLASSLAGGVVGAGTTTAINSANDYDGTIQSTGNWMVVAEWFNQLQVFKIAANGALTATTQGAVTDANADGAISFFIYPQTR